MAGETHFKFGRALGIGQRLVDAFPLRGVETFQSRDVLAGRLLGVLLKTARFIFRAAMLGRLKGSTITDARSAKTGITVELEKSSAVPIALHAASIYLTALLTAVFGLGLALLGFWVYPATATTIFDSAVYAVGAIDLHFLALIPALVLRDRPWSWLVHPLIGLLTVRDEIMARGIVRMLDEHSAYPAALAVVGRGHVSGIERELLRKYGFERVELEVIAPSPAAVPT